MNSPFILASPHNNKLVIKHTSTKALVLPEGEVEICVEKNASAHILASSYSHVRLILEAGAELYCYALSSVALDLKAFVHTNASLHIALFNLANLKSQALINIELLEPEARVDFLGLDQLGFKQKSFTELFINHKTPHTHSAQAFRGIYAGDSLGNFIGKVAVQPDAEHSSAKQLYKAILLSKEARALVKPELEIYNYNITASHGASIGQLDPEALFYLRSRGLNPKKAEKILVQSLSADITQKIHPLVRDYLSSKIELSLENLHE